MNEWKMSTSRPIQIDRKVVSAVILSLIWFMFVAPFSPAAGVIGSIVFVQTAYRAYRQKKKQTQESSWQQDRFSPRAERAAPAAGRHAGADKSGNRTGASQQSDRYQNQIIGPSVQVQLAQLQVHKDAGLFTQEEYTKKKAEILRKGNTERL